MAVPKTKHVVFIPATGLNIDESATLPAQVYEIKALSTHGPYMRVDIVANIDATLATFLGPPPLPGAQEPSKLNSLGESPKGDGGELIDLQVGQRIALRPFHDAANLPASEAQKQRIESGGTVTYPRGVYVELTAETPFTV